MPKRCESRDEDGSDFTYKTTQDEEHGWFSGGMCVTARNNLKTPTRITYDFMNSSQLQEMRKITQSFSKAG